jgi:hypothetical protein
MVRSDAGEYSESMCWVRDRSAGMVGVTPPSPPPLEACPRSSAAARLGARLGVDAVDDCWPSWALAIDGERPPDATVVSLNALLNE